MKVHINGEWWFLKLYILTITTFPISVKIIKNSSIHTIAIIILISIATLTIPPVLVNINLLGGFCKTVFYGELDELLIWLPCFLMGCTFAKFNLFTKIKKIFIKNRLDNIIVYIVIGLSVFLIRYTNEDSYVYDYLLAPVFYISAINIVKILRLNNVFTCLGKHSANMWLIHSFFCYQYFQQIVYYPKVAIIILIWLLLLSLECSVAIEFLSKKCISLVAKLKFNNGISKD